MVDLTLLEFYRNNYLINDKLPIIRDIDVAFFKSVEKVDKKKKKLCLIKKRILWKNLKKI